MYERRLMPSLRAALADTPVAMLVGPRQGGKSTLVQAMAERLGEARYRTLDDGLTLSAAREDPPGLWLRPTEP